MAKTQYLVAASIDGFIATSTHSLDWLAAAHAAASHEAEAARVKRFGDFFADVGAVAFGAATYEWVLGHERLLDEPERWHAEYGDRRCWVFTHRDLPVVPGARISFVSDDVRSVHQQMVAAAGERNVWLAGGGELVGQFADHGLLDEIILAIAPATLGSGAPLLPRYLTADQLTLTDCHADGTFAFLAYAVQAGDRP